MESGARSILSDRMEGPKPHFPLRLDDSATSMLPDRGKSPLTLAIDATTTQLNSVAESFKTHFPHGTDGTKSFLLQNLEGTMALLAARGVDAPYPGLTLDGLRPFLPYGGSGDSVKSYLQERLDKPHKSVRDRKDVKCSGSDRTTTTTSSSSVVTSVGDMKRFHHHHHHDRSRDHKSSNSHSMKKVPSPKSQLSNPRHDANLTHAIRELHDEEFGLDAVLLAEGGHVGAHCAVLAAASPFLKTILLHANDHPAIISVTGTSFSTLQSLVTCLYTGNIPTGASLYHLIEAAKLLKMEELAAVLQKTFFAQGGSLDMPPRSQQLMPSGQRSTTTTTSAGQELQPEKFGKKVRSNRLDQILYQKLNVNHLAPSDIPEQPPPHPPPSLVPPSQESSRVPPLFDSSRVPILEAPRVPPADHGGILSELLTKADPLRSIFSNPSIYSGIPDLAFDASRASTLKPLNLSKSGKTETLTSSTACTVSSSTTTTSTILSSTTTSCSPSSTMASSLASQTDLTLAGLTSLAPTLPGNMPGLLTPLTPSSLIPPSALVSLSTSSALASFGAQQHSTVTSKPKSSCGNSASRSRSTTKSTCSGRSISSTNTSRSSDNSGNPSHNLPLLYTLRSGMMTPEMAKELYEQLKINPQLSSLAGFNINSIPNLSSNLGSSATLQNLANLHNLSSLQGFPTLFPFLAPTTENSQITNVESGATNEKVVTLSPNEPPSNDYNAAVNSTSTNAGNLNSSVMTAEDGVLNLSSSAQTVRSESPGVSTSVAVVAATSGTTEETAVPTTTSDNGDQLSVGNIPPTEAKEEQTDPSAPEVTNVSTGCQTVGPIDPTDTCGTVVVASSSDLNCTLSNGCSISEEAKASILSGQLDPSNLPLLLMTSSGTLTGISQSQTSMAESIETTPDIQAVMPKDPSLINSEGADTGDDTSSIEVVEEIPGISQALQNRKALFHAGHVSNIKMGRKRKGCGDCEGCQVVEDCGQCRFCRDKAKFGGPNRLKQVCVYKRCVHAELEPEDSKKKRKSSGKKGRGKCGGCDGCQRTADCNECYACLHNAATQPPARRKVCEMRVCEQQQMEEVRATLSVAGEPSPYSTDSLMAEGIISSGTSSPTPDGQPSTHNDKMKLMRKMLKKKFAQPYSRVSPSKVRTKYYCGECPGCQTTTPCGNCLYCEDMPKFGGPGRYRQKCVKQLCVYHPRLQALKLSNRSKITYDEQHILPETLNHLGNVVPTGHDEAIVLGCDIHPKLKPEMEFDHMQAVENVETDLTEGEDSNTTIHVETILEEIPVEKQESPLNLERSPNEALVNPEVTSNICPSPPKLEENDDSTDTPTAVASIPEPVLPVVTDTLDSTSCVTDPLPEATHNPEPECESPPPTITHPPLVYSTLTMPSVSEVNATALPVQSVGALPVPSPSALSVHSDSNPNVMAVTSNPTPPPPPVRIPTPTDHKEAAPISVEVEEIEDDVEEEEEAGSDGSDVPSPPSTPSPPARARGRGRTRGRGRPHGKSTRHMSSAKKEKVMRRGRRRRTTRFTLEPDDNSDFEDQLGMSDLHDENSTEESVGGSQLAEGVQSEIGLHDDAQEVLPESLSLETTTQKQSYSSSFVGRSKPIEPDVFEFHDSQENVISNSHETTYSLKHNTPFVFRDEESSQGGRDVNENLGSVGETASA